MKWVAPILFILFCSFSFGESFIAERKPDASYDAARKYSIKEVKYDIATLRAKLERHNPNIYLYNTKKDLDKYFDSLSNAVKAPMTDMEVYRLLGPMTSRIKDAHTSVFPNENCEWWYGNQSYFLPLLVTCNNDHVVTDLCASSDRTIPDGSEVISINGKYVAEILSQMKSYAPRDGYNQSRVTWVLNNFFSYFYCYCLGDTSSFRIEYVPRGYDDIREHTIRATTVDSMWSNAYKYYPSRYISGRKDSTITMRFREDSSIAIMRIRSFAKGSPKSKDDSYRKVVHRCFEIINDAPVKDLVIDIRDNSGGNPEYARYLISHLIDKKFIYIEKYKTVERLRWNDEEKRTRTQWYPYCGIGTFSPEKNCYTGKLYVLMDGGSTSTAGDFAACLDYYDRATFIGEESGANRVVSGGNVFSSDFELPNTKLRVRLSTIQGINKTDIPNDGHGVIPDYEVVPTPEDYMNFRNPMLEKALELIHGSGKCDAYK
jgi:hypothetical protein